MFEANRILKYLILVMLLLMTVAIGSFFVGSSSFRDKDVQLELQVPAQAASGDEVVYEVLYRNSTKVTLHDIQFRFFYPEGAVVMQDGVAVQGSTEGFSVGDLDPGEFARKELRVYLVGGRGDIKTARVTMSFKAGSIRSSFEKSATSSTTIDEVPVALTLVAPPNIVSGQGVTYLLDYRNESGGDISDLRLEFMYPEGFTPQSYQPQPSQGNHIWDIATLRKDSGSRISIQGVLNGVEGESKAIRVVLKRKVGDQYVDYQRASSNTQIANPVVGLTVTVNDSKDYSATVGDNLIYKLSFKNNSNYNLLGLVLSVKLEGDMYDFSAISLGNGFFDETTKTVFWNASVYPDFAAFTSGMQGHISFSIRLKEQFGTSVPGASRDRFVKATIRLVTPNVPQGLGGDEIGTSTTVVTRITSQPTFNPFLYHQDMQFGSTGPLPPRAGEETTLTVRWQIANPGNDIANAEVVGTLPPGVTWLNNTSVGNGQPALSYNPNTSMVTWKLGTLPFGVGTYGPRYEAAFQVKIRPVASQRSQEVEVLKDIRFTGTDSFTSQPVNIYYRALDTGDVVDKPGQGRVE